MRRISRVIKVSFKKLHFQEMYDDYITAPSIYKK